MHRFLKRMEKHKNPKSYLIIVVTPATVRTLEVTWYTKHNTIYKVHNIAQPPPLPMLHNRGFLHFQIHAFFAGRLLATHYIPSLQKPCPAVCDWNISPSGAFLLCLPFKLCSITASHSCATAYVTCLIRFHNMVRYCTAIAHFYLNIDCTIWISLPR